MGYYLVYKNADGVLRVKRFETNNFMVMTDDRFVDYLHDNQDTLVIDEKSYEELAEQL